MKVLITGSDGKIGREAVAALQAAGHEVIGLDLKSSVKKDMRTIACDCTDFGQVMGIMSGVDTLSRPDAVLHLAGIPAPGMSSDDVVFKTNTLGNYNVFTAAARVGIRKLVWASSETIFGLPFTTPPDFVPLDETHPDRPEWSYSLTKKIGETMADELLRWYPGLSIISLRFSNVITEEEYANLSDMIDEGERKSNLWSYVDARDAGEACRLAIEAVTIGHERLVIAAADTIVDRPTEELMKEYYPNVPIKKTLNKYESLETSSKAAELIGYYPKFTWRKS
jgi:nucleoside-diphosphate-sugar epimerase